WSDPDFQETEPRRFVYNALVSDRVTEDDIARGVLPRYQIIVTNTDTGAKEPLKVASGDKYFRFDVKEAERTIDQRAARARALTTMPSGTREAAEAAALFPNRVVTGPRDRPLEMAPASTSGGPLPSEAAPGPFDQSGG